MKRTCTKATSWLLCLTTAWSTATNLGALAQSADSSPRLQGKATASPKFAAAQPELDTPPTPKAKPFTLGASQVFVKGSAEDEAQQNALKADTNFSTDPGSKPPLSGSTNCNRFNLQASATMRLLSKYNVQLLVDRSNSMGQKDCPGGLSRWEWCGEQAASLAQTISPLVPQGLTIVPFASEYDVFDHANAQNIVSLFNTMHLQLGTRLYEPLAEQFDTYFADHTPNKKPLLVVVITDGMPVPKMIEPGLVRKELVATSNRQKNANEVTVIFCQIGCQDAEGQAYLEDLDQHLADYGARYDIVHTIPFEELQEAGLGPALATSLVKYAPPVQAPAEPARLAHRSLATVQATVHVARLPRGGAR